MTDQHEDQAKKLRDQLNDINKNDRKREGTVDVNNSDDIDVLALPSRTEIYEEKEAKFRLKISYALIRLVVFIFVILVVLFLTYQFWGDWFFKGDLSYANHERNVTESVNVSVDTHLLSEEVTIDTVKEESGERTRMKGRYYLSLPGETLIQIVDRFYNSLENLQLIIDINQIDVEPDAYLQEGTRIFLPQ